MNDEHVTTLGREPTPAELDAAMRRARRMRSEAAFDLIGGGLSALGRGLDTLGARLRGVASSSARRADTSRA